MWEVCPDSRYVYPPEKGGKHTRGTTVDLTLVNFKTGKELEMPTSFDDFTEKAHTDFMGHSKEVIENRRILQEAMEKFGFKGIPREWWHFDIEGWQDYPALDIDF